MDATKQISYTDQELRCAGLLALTEHFGHANTLRFLALQHGDNADYLALRGRLFDDLSAKELYQQAAAFWQQRQSMEENH